VSVSIKDRHLDWFTQMRQRESELEHERRLAQVRAQSHALVWKGTPSELIATITRWFKLGWIEAESLQDALDRASIHFVGPDGKAITKPAVSVPIPENAQVSETTNPRQRLVIPLLDNKGWSILTWANEAGVAYHTASDYLTGIRTPRRSTIVKLADALGISPNLFPK